MLNAIKTSHSCSVLTVKLFSAVYVMGGRPGNPLRYLSVIT